MKVKLLISRGGLVDGRYISSQPGDVIEVGDDEGQRLIDNNRAVAVETAKPKKVTKKDSE